MDRTKSIGGSDVTRLFSNQEDAWQKLWEEKTGRRQPDDLSDIFHVQLGVATEAFNIGWFKKMYQDDLDINRIEIQHEINAPAMASDSKDVPLRSTLDGLVKHKDGWSVLECKHTNSFTNIDKQAEQYMPQLQFYLHMAKKFYIGGEEMIDGIYFANIFGNSKWECIHITYNPQYAHEIMKKVVRFWKFVTDDQPPQKRMPDPPQIKGILFDKKKKEDMSQSNSFSNASQVYVETLPTVKKHEEAKKDLLDHVQPNHAELYNDLLSINVSKTGRRTIKLKENANGKA